MTECEQSCTSLVYLEAALPYELGSSPHIRAMVKT